ncbi:MAG: hypothetical protein LIO57_07075 [Oscillospiraceae bacterium]|nr:hypothetical protein [Oscillospiraceae bacterium]
MLTRPFTKREKILLLLLAAIIVAAAYLLLVHYPVERELAEIEAEMQSVQSELAAAETVSEHYAAMSAELGERLADGAEAEMPDYDNMPALMPLFDKIFKTYTTEDSYSLSFSTLSDDGVVSRTVSFAFRCADWDDARAILSELNDTGYLSQMNSLTAVPTDRSLAADALTVTGSITFYELEY